MFALPFHQRVFAGFSLHVYLGRLLIDTKDTTTQLQTDPFRARTIDLPVCHIPKSQPPPPPASSMYGDRILDFVAIDEHGCLFDYFPIARWGFVELGFFGAGW